MAHRILPVSPAEGDILDPRDWTRSMAVFAEEYNGGLDRDNLPLEAVTAAMLPAGVFNHWTSHAPTAVVTLTGQSIAWVDQDSSGNLLGEIELDIGVDALLRAEWSGTWQDNPDWSLTRTTVQRNLVSFRLLVDGAPIARIYQSSAGRGHDNGYMVGARAVTAGRHRICVEARQWRAGNEDAGGQTILVRERELILWIKRR